MTTKMRAVGYSVVAQTMAMVLYDIDVVDITESEPDEGEAEYAAILFLSGDTTNLADYGVVAVLYANAHVDCGKRNADGMPIMRVAGLAPSVVYTAKDCKWDYARFFYRLWRASRSRAADSLHTMGLAIGGALDLVQSHLWNQSVGLCYEELTQAIDIVHMGEAHFDGNRIRNSAAQKHLALDPKASVLSVEVTKVLSTTLAMPIESARFIGPLKRWIHHSTSLAFVLNNTPIMFSRSRIAKTHESFEPFGPDHTTFASLMREFRQKGYVPNDPRAPLASDVSLLSVQPRWKPFSSATGRIMSTAPNVQGLPASAITSGFMPHFRGGELDVSFAQNPMLAPRAWVVARPDHVLVAADYRAMELCVIAAVTQDETLLQVVRSDEDPFKRMAKLMRTNMRRSDVKILVYGTLYGMGVGRIAATMKVSAQIARNRRTLFYRTFSGVNKYVTALQKRFADMTEHDRWPVEIPITGRSRTVTGDKARKPAAAPHAAFSTIIQSTAAFITVAAGLSSLWQLSAPHKERLLMIVHDELVFEVHRRNMRSFVLGLRNTMQTLPFAEAKELRVRVMTGQNLAAMMEVKT